MTLQQQIDSAKAALHDLMTGRSARVVVDQNGERVEFTSVNSDKLKAYIAGLEASLLPNRMGNGPLIPYF